MLKNIIIVLLLHNDVQNKTARTCCATAMAVSQARFESLIDMVVIPWQKPSF